MKLGLTITYSSGDTVTATVLPPEWVKWEIKTGRKITDIKGDDLLGMSDLAFLAYAALKREAAGSPLKPYDAWLETVAEIDPNELSPKVTPVAQSDG
jgi:hypothetical protein